MKNLIKKRLLRRYLSLKEYGAWFAPYFAVCAKYATRSAVDGKVLWDGDWTWTNEEAVRECLASTWDMLGAWNARRGAEVSRRSFEKNTPAAVRSLALCFNRHGVGSMLDLGQLEARTYEQVMGELVEAVLQLSSAKKTAVAEPMFGSKIAHHYFPSIVPVFDTAMVRNGVLRTSAYGVFEESDGEGWVPATIASEGREFAGYVGFLAAQVAEADKNDLAKVREAFGDAISHCAPMAMVASRRSVIWRLDAKLAEACACGEAQREGHLRRKPGSSSS